MNLADHLQAGTLPSADEMLVLDTATRDAVLAIQAQHGNPCHQMMPVALTDGRWGIGADVLSEASGLFAGTFQHVPRELAAAVAVISREQFMALLPQPASLERPAAESIGQEWTDADGTLWRVVQARGGDGQFLPDDPATAERESLERVEVQR